MPCPDCRPWPPVDTDTEPEADDCDIAEDGTITASVRIHNDCSGCSQELAETTFELEGSIDVGEHEGEGHELSAEVTTAQRSDRTQTHDRHGKPIKNYRYARRYYGVEVEIEVTCSCGAQLGSVQLSDEVQASGMDSLV